MMRSFFYCSFVFIVHSCLLFIRVYCSFVFIVHSCLLFIRATHARGLCHCEGAKRLRQSPECAGGVLALPPLPPCHCEGARRLRQSPECKGGVLARRPCRRVIAKEQGDCGNPPNVRAEFLPAAPAAVSLRRSKATAAIPRMGGRSSCPPPLPPCHCEGARRLRQSPECKGGVLGFPLLGNAVTTFKS
jgi:hypothetical protein